MALADQFDGFLVDLDGVVWTGSEPVPGAADALRELLERGKGVVFVTNNPGKPASAYAERLWEAGVEIGDEHVVTAGEATARLAAERAGRGARALVIGAPAFHETVAAAGLDPVAAGADAGGGAAGGEAGSDTATGVGAVDVVIVSGHRGFDYGELRAATWALQRGAALFATSRDPTLPMPGGAWPGTGAVLAAVETASSRRAEIGGKPEPHLFELALERLPGSSGMDFETRQPREGKGAGGSREGRSQRAAAGKRVAMVGDRVSSDIEGGRRAGLATVLVLSGATTREEAARAEPAPDHVIENVAGLLA